MQYQKVVKTEKKRKWKRLAGWIPVLLLLFALIIAVNIRFREIKVSGNRKYDAETIKQLVLPEGWDRNPLVAAYKNRFLDHKAIPFVSSYEVKLKGIDECEIVVYEKTPIGYIEYMSSYMYFDKDGIIIESSDERMDDIPEVTGLKFGRIVLGEKLKVDTSRLYEEIMNITQQLSSYEIPCKKIVFDSDRYATLYVDDGDIRVKIGNDDYLEAKLSTLGDIIGELRTRGLKGTVDLSNFNDRSDSGFIFTPDE